MIELYTWTTNNGRKPIVALEEMGIPYRLHWLDIWKGETRSAEHKQVHPLGMIPALVDPQGPGGEAVTVWESVMILIYLGEKTGKFLPTQGAKRLDVLQWTVFHTASVTPPMDQFMLFRREPDIASPTLKEMVGKRVTRRMEMMNDRLKGREYICDELSIADMAHYPLFVVGTAAGLDLAPYPHLKAWCDRMAARPKVARGITIMPEGYVAPAQRPKEIPGGWPLG